LRLLSNIVPVVLNPGWSALSAVQLVNGDVGELVAESFLQDVSWAVEEAHGDSDETSLGVASA
jgi:hypothetical protein